jgi:hypothetical protein
MGCCSDAPDGRDVPLRRAEVAAVDVAIMLTERCDVLFPELPKLFPPHTLFTW